MKKETGELFVTRPYLPPREEYDRYLDRIWEQAILTNHGPLHGCFESELTGFFDRQCVSIINNGHMALDVALKALDINGEVITTPFTFVSTTHALVTNGITPVFCDIRIDNLTIDPNLIERLITPKTTAILPVHVYGHPCDTQAIENIALKHGLKVIYDAAHAFGVRYQDRSVAAYGDVTMFSFHATKLFHSIEGGALTCGDEQLKLRFDAVKNYGFQGDVDIKYVGINAKMNEFQAAMGLCILPRISEIIQRRKAAVCLYRQRLEGLPGIRLFYPDADPAVEYNYAYMPILIDSKAFGATIDQVFQRLRESQIYARRYFYPLTSDFSCYAGLIDAVHIPVARAVADQVLCLPLWDSISPEQIKYVCDAVNSSKE